MRVALIAPPWLPVPPRGYGGTELVLDELARGLQRAGHEVLLFTTGDSDCPVPRAWAFEEALGIGPAEGPLLEIRHVMAAYEQARDADVIHDHTLVGPLYAAGFVNGGVVTTNHSPFAGGRAELYRAVSRRVPVIAISQSQASTAVGVNLAGVIHHGIDIDRFPLGDGHGGYALVLGRMAADKGVHTAMLVAREAGIPLVVAGKCSDPAEIAYFHDYVEPLLGGGIEFIGEVQQADKRALLAGASCLLNPIAWPEPFGMVMLESLACGTPVVATHRGAAPEIIEDGLNGVLADDHADLVAAVGKAMTLDRVRCRELVAERFSVERMVDGHVAVYEAAAERATA